MRFLPNNRHEWICLVFYASEAAVIGMTGWILALQASARGWAHTEFAAGVYGAYGAAFLALGISSLAVRLANPALARLGWFSIVVFGLICGIQPPMY